MNTVKVDLRSHNLQIIQESKEALNVWGAGEEFHHSPDQGTVKGRNELIEHHIHSGATQRLSDQHEIVAS